jgi:ammonium transporter, Amt family
VGLFSQDSILSETTGNGLFYGGGMGLLVAQIKGIVSVGAFTFLLSLVVFYIIKATIGLRVSLEEEIGGLDIGEHGQAAYPEFMTRKASHQVADVMMSDRGR